MWFPFWLRSPSRANGRPSWLVTSCVRDIYPSHLFLWLFSCAIEAKFQPKIRDKNTWVTSLRHWISLDSRQGERRRKRRFANGQLGSRKVAICLLSNGWTGGGRNWPLSSDSSCYYFLKGICLFANVFFFSGVKFRLSCPGVILAKLYPVVSGSLFL